MLCVIRREATTRDLILSSSFGHSPALGLRLTLGAWVISRQVKVALSSSTQLSRMSSPTSPTAILMVFHWWGSSLGLLTTVMVSVKPSASIE